MRSRRIAQREVEEARLQDRQVLEVAGRGRQTLRHEGRRAAHEALGAGAARARARPGRGVGDVAADDARRVALGQHLEQRRLPGARRAAEEGDLSRADRARGALDEARRVPLGRVRHVRPADVEARDGPQLFQGVGADDGSHPARAAPE